jgi:hypothetical protein
MEHSGSSYGRWAVIILAGLVLIGDLIFTVHMAGDVFK